jgi:hypothetical protein
VFGRCKEVAKGVFIRPAHAATKLVKIAQSKLMRIIDDNGIGIGYIDACLDDIGSEEYIKLFIDKLEQDLFELVTLHLAMRHSYIYIGHDTY